MSEKIIIFDTTLRDGEQTPGANLNVDEKLQIARHLELLNVDVIEAGFPFFFAGRFCRGAGGGPGDPRPPDRRAGPGL